MPASPESPPSRGRTLVIVIALAALVVTAAVAVLFVRHSASHLPRSPVVPRTPPPDPSVTAAPAVRAAAASVVRVTGTSPSCGRRSAGSGFVFAPGQVLTAAHVVSGARSTTVSAGTAKRLHATVVKYDPGRDVAVLHVPGLTAPALTFTGARAGDSGVIVGYPKDQRLVETPARIYAVQNTRGPDLYHRRITTREVLFLRGQVARGDSGGPLLATDGRVSGLVFAANLEDPMVGYALTAHELRPDADRTATAPVSTGPCAE